MGLCSGRLNERCAGVCPYVESEPWDDLKGSICSHLSTSDEPKNAVHREQVDLPGHLLEYLRVSANY